MKQRKVSYIWVFNYLFMSKIITFSEAASIALHGMIMVAKSDGLINVATIAKATSSSRHHVAKVFQRLVKENFISSHRGPNGGFSLKIAPGKVTFLQIYEAIEGKIKINDCPIEKPVCPFESCIMNNVTLKMTVEFREYLKSQTLDNYL